MNTEAQENQLKELNRVFLEENTKLNLSALRTEDACWNGNVLDSVAGVEVIKELEPKTTLLDLGTGGGFPLLPLALLFPDMQLTGMDATQKKIDAIQRIVDQMNMQNATLVAGRSEELAHNSAHREQYDIVTARAVAPLNTLLELAAPFAKKGGRLLLWKSMQIDQELQDSLLARAELSCHLTDKHEYTLPDDWGTRQILIFEKTSPTPKNYPREVGTPKKSPLL